MMERGNLSLDEFLEAANNCQKQVKAFDKELEEVRQERRALQDRTEFLHDREQKLIEDKEATEQGYTKFFNGQGISRALRDDRTTHITKRTASSETIRLQSLVPRSEIATEAPARSQSESPPHSRSTAKVSANADSLWSDSTIQEPETVRALPLIGSKRRIEDLSHDHIRPVGASPSIEGNARNISVAEPPEAKRRDALETIRETCRASVALPESRFIDIDPHDQDGGYGSHIIAEAQHKQIAEKYPHMLLLGGKVFELYCQTPGCYATAPKRGETFYKGRKAIDRHARILDHQVGHRLVSYSDAVLFSRHQEPGVKIVKTVSLHGTAVRISEGSETVTDFEEFRSTESESRAKAPDKETDNDPFPGLGRVRLGEDGDMDDDEDEMAVSKRRARNWTRTRRGSTYSP